MSEWISVKDKLPHERFPDDYEYVLVYAQKEGNEPGPISIARHYKRKWEMLSEESESNAVACGDLTWYMDAEEVTHWMPLPKTLPKE